jgi:hypothetical protein
MHVDDPIRFIRGRWERKRSSTCTSPRETSLDIDIFRAGLGLLLRVEGIESLRAKPSV